MKTHYLPIFALLISSIGWSQDVPSGGLSMTQLLLPAASGVNSAARPWPKFDWVERARDLNQDAHRHPEHTNLIFDGDSITAFWRTKNGFPAWSAHYDKLGAFDFGIAGDRTEHLLWRLSQGQVDGLHPKLIVLLIGTNNLAGNSVQEIADAITLIVKEYRARCPQSTLLIQGIFPRGKNATDPARAKIKEINAIISKLQDGQNVLYFDLGDKFLSADGSISPEIMGDFLHPTEKGYAIWADAIQPFVDRFVLSGK